MSEISVAPGEDLVKAVEIDEKGDPDRLERNRRRPLFGSGNFSPIEHFITGGSAFVNGQSVNYSELLERFEQGDEEAQTTLLTPIDIQNGKRSLRTVARKRAQERRDRTQKGIFPIFTFIPQIALAKTGIEFFLEPSMINGKTSRIHPEWKIMLVDQERNPVLEQAHWQGIDITDEHKSHFRLETVPNAPYRLLKLQLPKKA